MLWGGGLSDNNWSLPCGIPVRCQLSNAATFHHRGLNMMEGTVRTVQRGIMIRPAFRYDWWAGLPKDETMRFIKDNLSSMENIGKQILLQKIQRFRHKLIVPSWNGLQSTHNVDKWGYLSLWRRIQEARNIFKLDMGHWRPDVLWQCQ